MAFLDTGRARVWRLQTITPGAVLFAGTGIFLHSVLLAVFVSIQEHDDAVWQLTSLGRQGYPYAWIMDLGFACWGVSVFSVALSLDQTDRKPLRLGLLFMGAAGIALAQWSAAPMTGEIAKSAIETRVHTVFGVLAICGLALACAASCMASLSDGVVDKVSACVLVVVWLCFTLLVFAPSTTGWVELCLALSASVWTVLRLPELLE